jgi:hypothetical protein
MSAFEISKVFSYFLFCLLYLESGSIFPPYFYRPKPSISFDFLASNQAVDKLYAEKSGKIPAKI